MSLSPYLNFLKIIAKDKNEKKNFFRILKELVHLTILKGELPTHYASARLYNKGKTNYTDYLGFKEMRKLHASQVLHKYEYSSILDNKLSFALFCEKMDLPSPETLGFNLNTSFYSKGRPRKLTSEKEVYGFFKDLMDETDDGTLFVKQVSEMGGSGCYFLTYDNLAEKIEAHYTRFTTSSFIHQKRLKQHPIINKIYRHSINTLRFDTYIDNNGRAHILSVMMRIGSGGSVLDNISTGGFSIAVDLETACLKGNISRRLEVGTELFTRHPDTQTELIGFKVPYFAEACELVVRCADYIPDRLAGWDIAICEQGPVVIEGNSNPGLISTNKMYGGYLKHPLFKEIMTHI